MTGLHAQRLLNKVWRGASSIGPYYWHLDRPTQDGTRPADVFEAAADAMEREGERE